VAKDPFVAYNPKKQRVRYLGLGAPALGANGGNTASDTHRLLQTIMNAQKATGDFGDGGWKGALSVSALANEV
jgi:hypothetical protein